METGLSKWVFRVPPPPNIIRVIKSRRMSWAGHVARVGRRENEFTGFGGET
jgi:hypothetical protein